MPEFFDSKPYEMRQPCKYCGHLLGYIATNNGQDVVRCKECNKANYNAPKSETGRPQRHVRTREAIKPGQRTRVLERANGRCEMCGLGIRVESLHVDHLLPLNEREAIGMTEDEANSEDNLCALCAECNMGKADMLLRPTVILGIIRRRRIR